MWKQVDEEKEALFKLMLEVQAKLRGREGDASGKGSEVALRRCKWSEVMDEVQTTARRWKTSPTKQSKAMVFIDKIGQHSGALESWLGVLPEGDYGSRCVRIGIS